MFEKMMTVDEEFVVVNVPSTDKRWDYTEFYGPWESFKLSKAFALSCVNKFRKTGYFKHPGIYHLKSRIEGRMVRYSIQQIG